MLDLLFNALPWATPVLVQSSQCGVSSHTENDSSQQILFLAYALSAFSLWLSGDFAKRMRDTLKLFERKLLNC